MLICSERSCFKNVNKDEIVLHSVAVFIMIYPCILFFFILLALLNVSLPFQQHLSSWFKTQTHYRLLTVQWPVYCKYKISLYFVSNAQLTIIREVWIEVLSTFFPNLRSSVTHLYIKIEKKWLLQFFLYFKICIKIFKVNQIKVVRA